MLLSVVAFVHPSTCASRTRLRAARLHHTHKFPPAIQRIAGALRLLSRSP